MRLFYFTEKSTTPLRHGSKSKKKHVSVKKLICKKIFASVEAFLKTKENGENMYKMMNAWLMSCRGVLAFSKK